MKIILKTAGFFHLLYYGLILCYAGIRTTFAGFWLAAGSGLILMSALPEKWLSFLKYPLGPEPPCSLFRNPGWFQGPGKSRSPARIT